MRRVAILSAPATRALGARCSAQPRRRGASGFTLVDALVAVVVVSLCATTLQSGLSVVQRRSADPLEAVQLAALGQQFADEIAVKAYDVSAGPPATPGEGACARSTFNDVRDYNGYATSGICTIDGQPVASLARYGVSISVTPQSWLGVSDALRVDVTVTGPSTRLGLTTWRTNPA